MIRSQLSAETYAAIDEIVRIGSRGVAKAQERNRRLGVPNVYWINGRLYYETSNGELSATDPFSHGQRATEQSREPGAAKSGGLKWTSYRREATSQVIGFETLVLEATGDSGR